MTVKTRPDRFTAPEQTNDSGRHAPREAEAPDRGDSEHEAPEVPTGRQAEAPDAGEGRMNTLEHEFTHGRSQS